MICGDGHFCLQLAHVFQDVIFHRLLSLQVARVKALAEAGVALIANARNPLIVPKMQENAAPGRPNNVVPLPENAAAASEVLG